MVDFLPLLYTIMIDSPCLGIAASPISCLN